VSLIRQSPPVAASNMKAIKCWSVPSGSKRKRNQRSVLRCLFGKKNHHRAKDEITLWKLHVIIINFKPNNQPMIEQAMEINLAAPS
jgi:hypothetical protein